FFHTWYSPGRMALVVLGQDPLDDLEVQVRRQFGQLPAGKSPEEKVSVSLFAPGFLPSRVNIEASHSGRRLSLLFPVPKSAVDPSRKPDIYVTHLLTYEGE